MKKSTKRKLLYKLWNALSYVYTGILLDAFFTTLLFRMFETSWLKMFGYFALVVLVGAAAVGAFILAIMAVFGGYWYIWGKIDEYSCREADEL